MEWRRTGSWRWIQQTVMVDVEMAMEAGLVDVDEEAAAEEEEAVGRGKSIIENVGFARRHD